jgi:hypothetical protein
MSLGWERLRRRLQVTGAAALDSAAAAEVVEAAAAVVEAAAVDSTAAEVDDSAGIWMLLAKSGMDPPDPAFAPGATQFEPVNPAGSVGLLDLYFPPY